MSNIKYHSLVHTNNSVSANMTAQSISPPTLTTPSTLLFIQGLCSSLVNLQTIDHTGQDLAGGVTAAVTPSLPYVQPSHETHMKHHICTVLLRGRQPHRVCVEAMQVRSLTLSSAIPGLVQLQWAPQSTTAIHSSCGRERGPLAGVGTFNSIKNTNKNTNPD